MLSPHSGVRMAGEGDLGGKSCMAFQMPMVNRLPSSLAHQNSWPIRSISTAQCMRMRRAMGSEALTAAVKSGPAPPGNTKQNPRRIARCSSAKQRWSNPIAPLHGVAGVMEVVESVSLSGVVATLSSSLAAGVVPWYRELWCNSLRSWRRVSAVRVPGCSATADASP